MISLSVQMAIYSLAEPRESPHCIIDTIAYVHGLHAAALPGQDRTVDVSRARSHVAYMMRLLRPDLSLSQVGRHLNRSHHTINYAIRVFDERVRPHIGPQIREAERLLGGGAHA